MKERKEEGFPSARIPVSTYRLQLNNRFRFTDACAVVSYLHDLGISDLYTSPYLKARKGSMHGYDIVDPTRLNPEVGTEEEYDSFVNELGKYGMGHILDIVPNHMCCESDNPWWMDVLENGPCSPYAAFFDIDWDPAVRKLAGKLLIPLLGDQYGKVLEKQELKLVFEEGAFFIYYYEQKFPILPETYTDILQHRLEELRDLLCEDNPRLTEFLSIVTALKHLPPVTETNPENIRERYREKEIVKKRLLALCTQSPEIKDHLDQNIGIFNGVAGDSKSLDLLDGLLDGQLWRLSHWRVATEEINYRRFFDINNLSAIRTENPLVFEETHSLILRLVKERKITGLRVDHTDGLYDPLEYFSRLQSSCFNNLVLPETLDAVVSAENEQGEATGTLDPYKRLLESEPQYKPFYIIGEKILIRAEKMPEDWPVFGTTGYVFLSALNGIFVDSRNARHLDRLYTRVTGIRSGFSDVAYEKKKLFMQIGMAGEINTLGHHLSIISEKNRHTRDFTLNSLTKAITEVIALFPVYRTYIHSWSVADRDRQYIEAAVSKARRKNPAMDASIFDFLEDVLLLKLPEDLEDADKSERLDFVQRFQQLTSPVMAKGVEDTAFYVYNRLVSLNEVGGNPERFGQSLEAFHGQNIDRLKFWPHAFNATSTHDTKRSEDVRARINVLSEIPEKWRAFITRWCLLNKRKKTMIEGQAAPDRNEEYLLYQTLVGSWPLRGTDAELREFADRIRDYMVKALREAKVNTSWISPNIPYEEAVLSFIDAILASGPGNRFLPEFIPFQEEVSHFGMLNSLSQTLLKIAAVGVPDFYQGTEIWDFSLVDPDNRRPVDFKRRRDMLNEMKEREGKEGPDIAWATGLLERWEDGYIKLYVTKTTLTFRKDHQTLFMSGAYIPLMCEVERKDHICAFARKEDDEAVLIIAPRFTASLLNMRREFPIGEKVWGKAAIVLPEEIPGDVFFNVFTGETVKADRESGKRTLPVSGIFSSFPVAMLEMRQDLAPEKQQ
jgi:(1->4)-alpha-D-glucan 1-alpha-D-glucosylmutase